MDIFKILAVCLIAAVISLVLRGYKPEYSFSVILAAGVIIILYIVKGIAVPLSYIKSQLESYGVATDYFGVSLKCLGIGYITAFIADACRDSGQQGLALKAELAGKCAIFILSLPLLSAVLSIALGFLK